MIVVLGNDSCSGVSIPTPFCKSTIDVKGEMTGRKWSDKEGTASSRALFAHMTIRIRVRKCNNHANSNKLTKRKLDASLGGLITTLPY